MCLNFANKSNLMHNLIHVAWLFQGKFTEVNFTALCYTYLKTEVVNTGAVIVLVRLLFCGILSAIVCGRNTECREFTGDDNLAAARCVH